MEYKVFKAKGYDVKRLTGQELTDCRTWVEKVERENEAAYQAALKQRQQLLDQAAMLYGKRSREYRYLQRAPLTAPPHRANRNQLRELERTYAQHQERRVKNARRQQLKAEREEHERQEREVRNAKARARRPEYEARRAASRDELVLAGYEPGVDFSWFTPIRDALWIAQENEESENSVPVVS